MKKKYIYFLTIFILLLLLILGIKKNKKTSSLTDKRNFSIEDTLSINQIILENRSLEKIKLYRDPNSSRWILNDSLVANKYSINLLLKTIKEMRIKNPVARAALQNIIKRMAIQNTRIDIFQKDKKIKTIYVGGETPDQLGTYMKLKGGNEPYVLYIPGFTGYLSSRFSCKEQLWKSKKIFNNTILHAEYIFKDSNEQNFIIKNANNLSSLNNTYCESFLISNENFNIDEIKNRIPFLIIKIKNDEGNIEELNCIRKMPVNKEKYRDHKYDRERFYGFKNNTIMLIQYKQFENFIKSESIIKKIMPWKKQTLN